MVRFTASSSVADALRDPDVLLMLKVRAGDQQAFEELYRRYHTRVHAVIDHLMGHHNLTEDLAQEVFLRVYRARLTYVVGAKFSTWLFTIVNNVVSNARRSLARRRETNVTNREGTHEDYLDRLNQTSRFDTPLQAAERGEVRRLVLSGIDRLGERQRMAIVLCDLQGMSYGRVADALGTSTDAAKSLIHRGRARLRRMLENPIKQGNLEVISS